MRWWRWGEAGEVVVEVLMVEAVGEGSEPLG